MTARAVGQRLWSSGVPPARRQQGRVKSRHAALRSAYRVMAECRRSATMSADVGGDGGGETARAVGSGWWGSSASPKRCVVCGVCSPMRPPLRSVRMGFLKNSASPMRGRTLALLREVPSGCGQAAAYLVARGGLIRKMWSVARVNDVYSHR